MARHLISSGSKFEAEIGYSRAVVDGDWIFMSGTTGFDYKANTISDDIVKQTEQCFVNIKTAMEQAGFSLADAVRVHYILANAGDFEKIWPVLKKYVGTIKPAITMWEGKLSDPRMKIEIEVTGKKRS
ncbi:MAG: RidA family protein [Alphaproteobacteria bacterium]|nr:RidA family protein [Alphaproteobacteria bacterium]